LADTLKAPSKLVPPSQITRKWQDYFAERAFHKKFGITRQQAGIKPS
jgi:hypothetical protein